MNRAPHTPLELLAQLERALQGRSPRELSNLSHELVAVLRRLEGGLFTEAHVLDRNVFDVQARTQEYFTYFAGWHAQAGLLAALFGDLSDHELVLDLCPGWAPKVELALLQRGYRGSVLAIDANPEALDAMREFLALLAPPFALETRRGDLFALPPAARAPLVVGNHLVDDVLFERWRSEAGLARGELYASEQATRAAWSGLVAALPQLEREVLPQLAQALAAHVAPGGRLVLTQYPSHVEQLLDAPEATRAFAHAFAQLRRELAALGFDELPLGAEAHAAGANPATAAMLRARR